MDVGKIDTLTDIHRHIRADIRDYGKFLTKFRDGCNHKRILRLNLRTIGNSDCFEFNIELNDETIAFIEKQKKLSDCRLVDIERKIREEASE